MLSSSVFDLSHAFSPARVSRTRMLLLSEKKSSLHVVCSSGAEAFFLSDVFLAQRVLVSGQTSEPLCY